MIKNHRVRYKEQHLRVGLGLGPVFIYAEGAA